MNDEYIIIDQCRGDAMCIPFPSSPINWAEMSEMSSVSNIWWEGNPGIACNTVKSTDCCKTPQ